MPVVALDDVWIPACADEFWMAAADLEGLRLTKAAQMTQDSAYHN